MWYNHNFFKYSSAILLFLLIIFMLGKINFFLSPFVTMVSTVFMPLLITGLFYYMLRPIVRFMEKKMRFPKVLAIFATYFLVIILFILIGRNTGSIILHQFNDFTSNLSFYIEKAIEKVSGIINNQWIQYIPPEELNQRVSQIIDNITKNLSRFAFGLFSTVTNIGTLLFTVPFILYFFLQDDHKFISAITNVLPDKHAKNLDKILRDVDEVLSSYIAGQVTIALAVGIMMFIGYNIIGLRYSLILSIFSIITSIIPYFGPWIGIVPAIIVGLTQNPFMALKVLITMLVVQQIDGSLISPNVMGKRLSIHPVTIVLILMSAMSVYGFIGLLIAVPVYAAIKAILLNLYKMYISP